MNLTWIECFLAAAEHGGFSKAAGALFLTQQTVSKYVSRLEEYLGAPLFDRTKTPPALTPAGIYYRSLFSSAVQGLKSLPTGCAGRAGLAVGCSEYIDALGEMGKAVRSFAPEGVPARLSYFSMSNEELIKALFSGELDAALISGAQLTARYGLEAVAVAEEELCLFGPADIVGAAAQKRAALPYLIKEGQRSRFETSAFCSQELESMAFTPQRIKVLPNIAALREEMSRLCALSVSDRRFGALSGIPGLGAEPLGESSMIHCCYLTANDNPALPLFVEHLQNRLKA